ncbi:high affinity cAMP-specific and IBMX-insensitive 3',5'-cyclic phosphodiesterase 8B-like isoform X5 [Branchiostoma lanceolatum]|uniref:high affinity cAMP-specific and IBMX-insensitive 3',5'-cyclic phosphodiesterase 8B-like isoform X5 n=1 Tax=Branchiostoma lanceolatum TaxID=7740 RepID=UPI0034543543
MGCAPSIHVSQSGVVYCRDSDGGSNSPHPSGFSRSYHTHIHHGAVGPISIKTEATDGDPPTLVQTLSVKKERRGTITFEAETQTSRTNMKEQTGLPSQTEDMLGPMKVKKPAIRILLVFAKEDSQSDTFWWACERLGYRCELARNSEGALEAFLQKHHDLVIIDHRHSRNFDAEALCRSIRAIKSCEHAVVVAVTRKSPNEKEEPSILPLLNAGFNRRYTENTNLGACINELLMLDHSEIRARNKLKACQALFAAIENVSEAIEICNQDHQLMYVNPGYERLTGFTSQEVVGKEKGLPKSDKNSLDLQDAINTQIKKGKSWEGTVYDHRKNGDSIQQHIHISPVLGHGGKITHYVTLRRSAGQTHTSGPLQCIEKLKADSDLHLQSDCCRRKGSNEFNTRKSSLDIKSTHSGNSCFEGAGGKRRDSIARIHAMTIEAPITKVINIINAAQENCPINVVQALDKVLEILRSAELYSPQLTSTPKDNDPVTSDLVEGLMTCGSRRRYSSDIALSKNILPQFVPSSPHSHLPDVPSDVQAILDKEPQWDFDIIELERVTNKRPLLYLGMKIFSRFGVCEVLNCSEVTLRLWLQLIERNYHQINAYHNSTHAADVLHATAYFLNRDRIAGILDNMNKVAALLAAVSHDVDHPGRTNSFLCNASSELATLYNDVAVLESHHSALTFQLTWRDDRCNIFKNLSRDDYRMLRQQIIDMILATEMTRHFEHLSKFANSISKMGASARVEDDRLSSHSGGMATPEHDTLRTLENRTLINRMLIKCADIANPARPLDLCVEWAKRIAEEYCQQTDEEKERGLPVVMPVFDRASCSIPKSQISFIDYFLTDMFDAWDAFVDTPSLITHLTRNYKYWKGQAEEAERRGESVTRLEDVE